MESASRASKASSGRRAIALVCALIFAALVSLGLTPSAQAAPVQYFYVPFPEDELLTALKAINGDAVSPITSYITITAIADGTHIYYDQWEDGYDVDITNTYKVYDAATRPAGTQIWGDGNTANGTTPGTSDDLIHAGQVIILRNTVAVTSPSTLQSVIDFDGRDKIAATKPIAVTRSGWAAGSGTLHAGSVEVYDTNGWGTDYRAPVGVDIKDTNPQVAAMFEYTALTIMAGEGGAQVQIDANGDGTFESTVSLTEGETEYVTGVHVGGHVVSDNPVQVHIFIGDVGSGYESRDSALIPTGTWSNDYYTPVSTVSTGGMGGWTGSDTTVWLFNPGDSAIYVNYVRRVGGGLTTNPIRVEAGSYAKQVLPAGTGSRFYTDDVNKPFYAFSTTDSNSSGRNPSDNDAWDWGFSLIPSDRLSTQALVGLGIGRDPDSSINPTENGNPVWITTVGNGDNAETVYVDYDADPANGYNASYSLRELEQQKIYVPSLSLAHDATTSAAVTGMARSSLSFNHTTGSEQNRLMLVGVAINNDPSPAASVGSVTYGGVLLTKLGSVTSGAGSGGARAHTEIWALANPETGRAQVVINLTGARTFSAGATTFSGVDVSNGLISALGPYASSCGTNGTTASVLVSTTAGDWVYDVAGAERSGASSPGTFNSGTGQSRRWAQAFNTVTPGSWPWSWDTTTASGNAASSTATATGSSYTMSESWGRNNRSAWASSGVAIKPVATSEYAQTGILVYTLNKDVKIVAAWGQDPLTASASEPGLDVGTAVPPMPEFEASKDSSLYQDNDGDGYIGPGDVIEYTINVFNVSRIPVPDVIVKDEIPDDATYVPGSASISDDPYPATPFPLDEGGKNIGTLPVGGSYTITFRVIIDDFNDLRDEIPGQPGVLEDPPAAIVNSGSAYALGCTNPVNDKAFLRARIGGRAWHDTSTTKGTQDPGEGGIAGITVTLLDMAGEQVYTDQGVAIQTVTTENGLYDFMGLLPGSYRVHFKAPENVTISPQGQGGDTTLDSDADPVTGMSGVITLVGGQIDNTIDAGFYITDPTLAVVGGFDAYLAGGGVVVSWNTLVEAGTIGFNVERRLDGDGSWVTVNDGLIPALLESPIGGSYSVVDPGAAPYAAATYRLVEIEITGKTRTYGPYHVVPQRPLLQAEANNQISRGSTVARVPLFSAEQVESRVEDFLGLFRREATGTDRMRIKISKDGLYYLDVADIASALGISEARARLQMGLGAMKLTNQGGSVAYMPTLDGSRLYFYGRAVDSIYTAENVYWLTLGLGTMMRPAISLAGPGRNLATTHLHTAHFEENDFPAATVFHDPSADFWLWKYLSGGSAENGSATVTVTAPDAISGKTLAVTLQGIYTAEETDRHHVQVLLNGTLLGEAQWAGTTGKEASFPIPAGVLVAGDNQVQVVALCDPGVLYSVWGLDSIDLTYERPANAVDDQLIFSASKAGSVQVGGLSRSNAWVFDLKDPQKPAIVLTSLFGAASSSVTFNAGAGRRYLVATEEGALRPDGLVATTAPTLKGAGRGADYLIITTAELSAAAQRLAAYRAGQGLKTAVVDTSEIYDQFNNGLSSPKAIQDFLKYALTKWKPVPQYVVLAGEGSYDYKDYWGFGDSLVPPLMVDTNLGLAPSDVALADISGGDGVPESAIGRIPAQTEAELDAVLAKIQAYEAADGSWRQTVVLAADNSDNGGAFSVDSDRLAAVLPPSLTISKAYLDGISVDDARNLLFGGFSNGALLVNYTGHAGVHQLATEGLLVDTDVPALVGTGPNLPILSLLTCVVGQYALPGIDSLGEALTMAAAGGAVAVFAPTTMEDNDDSVLLGTLFAEGLFDPSHSVVLGDVVRRAQSAGKQQGLTAPLLRTYNLLGDPALRVRW